MLVQVMVTQINRARGCKWAARTTAIVDWRYVFLLAHFVSLHNIRSIRGLVYFYFLFQGMSSVALEQEFVIVRQNEKMDEKAVVVKLRGENATTKEAVEMHIVQKTVPPQATKFRLTLYSSLKIDSPTTFHFGLQNGLMVQNKTISFGGYQIKFDAFQPLLDTAYSATVLF